MAPKKLIELRMIDTLEWPLQRTPIVQQPNDPETRCREKNYTLECYLKGPRTSAGEAMVHRMWDARVNHVGEYGPIMAIVRAVSLAHVTLGGLDGEHVEAARSTFEMLLEERCPDLVATMTPEIQPLIDDAIRGWGPRARSAGSEGPRPTKVALVRRPT